MNTAGAIRLLDSKTRRGALKDIPPAERASADREACDIAVWAMRLQLGGTKNSGCVQSQQDKPYPLALDGNDGGEAKAAMIARGLILACSYMSCLFGTIQHDPIWAIAGGIYAVGYAMAKGGGKG